MKPKPLTLLFLLGFMSLKAFSIAPGSFMQPAADTNAPERRVYVGVATGYNNSTGLFGFTTEVYLYKGLNVIGGLGLGTWGYKPMIGLRYYFNYPYRYAIGMGYSYALGYGRTPVEVTLPVADSLGNPVEKQVPIVFEGVSVVNFSIMKFWRVGKRCRFNVEVGYAVPFKEGYAFRIMSNDKVSLQNKQLLQLLQPGGPMLSAGFSFRI